MGKERFAAGAEPLKILPRHAEGRAYAPGGTAGGRGGKGLCPPAERNKARKQVCADRSGQPSSRDGGRVRGVCPGRTGIRWMRNQDETGAGRITQEGDRNSGSKDQRPLRRAGGPAGRRTGQGGEACA